MNNLPDDLLISIFIRVSDCSTTFRLRSVCRRWKSLLGDPLNVRNFKGPPCGFLIQNSRPKKYNDTKSQNRIVLVDEFFKLRSISGYKKKMRIRATFEHELLLSSSPTQYYVQNPYAKRLIRLLEAPVYDYQRKHYHEDGAPGGFGLVFKGNSYRAVLFHVSGGDDQLYVAWVYSSQTLEWTRNVAVRPLPSSSSSNIHSLALQESDGVVCCRGILYWKHTTANLVQSVLRFDPFEKGCLWGFTEQPPDPHHVPPNFEPCKVFVGESRGRVRIWRTWESESGVTYFDVWEAAEEGMSDDARWKWRSVHSNLLDFTTAGISAASFHPNNGRLVFLIDHTGRVFRYNFTTRKARMLAKILLQVSTPECFSVFPIPKLPSPTRILSL